MSMMSVRERNHRFRRRGKTVVVVIEDSRNERPGECFPGTPVTRISPPSGGCKDDACREIDREAPVWCAPTRSVLCEEGMDIGTEGERCSPFNSLISLACATS